jgi:hypothetical protein
LTQREEDKRVRRGNAAAKGATVIFWRLAGGEEDGLLAPRDLLFDLEAIELCGGETEEEEEPYLQCKTVFCTPYLPRLYPCTLPYLPSCFKEFLPLSAGTEKHNIYLSIYEIDILDTDQKPNGRFSVSVDWPPK